MRIPKLLFLFMALAALSPGAETLEEQAQQVVQQMGGSRNVSNPRLIAALSEEDRQILIRYYRSKLETLTSKDSSDPKVKFEAPEYRTQLLKLGDPDEIAQTLKVFRESAAGPARDKAATDLLSSERPEVITLLAPAIMVDEPFVMPPIQGDVGSALPFTHALANSILGIVANSAAFSDEVRNWADGTRKVHPQKSLPVIRDWWKENESSLKAKNFDAVKAGADVRAADLARKKFIEDRRQQYRENLIAQGKSPADTENWKQWNEVIDPSLIVSSAGDNRIAAQPSQPTPVGAVSKPRKAAMSDVFLYILIGGGAPISIVAILYARIRKGGPTLR